MGTVDVCRAAKRLSLKQSLALKYIASGHRAYKDLIHKNTAYALMRKRMIDKEWNLTKLGVQVFDQHLKC